MKSIWLIIRIVGHGEDQVSSPFLAYSSLKCAERRVAVLRAGAEKARVACEKNAEDRWAPSLTPEVKRDAKTTYWIRRMKVLGAPTP